MVLDRVIRRNRQRAAAAAERIAGTPAEEDSMLGTEAVTLTELDIVVVAQKTTVVDFAEDVKGDETWAAHFLLELVAVTCLQQKNVVKCQID